MAMTINNPNCQILAYFLKRTDLAVSALAGSNAAVKEFALYAVGGFGYGSVKATPAASFDARADIAYALSIGYQINKVLGVEAGCMLCLQGLI